jgi:hypothetical protein
MLLIFHRNDGFQISIEQGMRRPFDRKEKMREDLQEDNLRRVRWAPRPLTGETKR